MTVPYARSAASVRSGVDVPCCAAIVDVVENKNSSVSLRKR
jgi:hypothetical protein